MTSTIDSRQVAAPPPRDEWASVRESRSAASSLAAASSSAGFAGAVAQVRAMAAQLASGTKAGAWSTVPAAAAGELVAALLAARDVLDAVAAAGVGVVHAGGVLPGGHVSTSRWLQAEAGLSRPAAGALLARGRSDAERELPLTRIAALSGRLSADRARAVAVGLRAALRPLRPQDRAAAVAAVEGPLVEYARTASVAAIGRKTARLRFTLDPDTADARAVAAYTEQHLRLTPVGDGVVVDGWLTAQTAAALATCLEQTIDRWYRTGEHTPDRPGAPVPAAVSDLAAAVGAPRRPTRTHLQALALGELCERLLDHGGAGTRHRQRPHLTLTVDAADLAGDPTGPGPAWQIPGLGSLPAPRSTAARILCDADVTPVITTTTGLGEDDPRGPRHQGDHRGSDRGSDFGSETGRHAHRDGVHPDGEHHRTAPRSRDLLETFLADLREQAREVLHVGRTARTAPPRLRRALATRDHGCIAPGCDVDPSRCHAHHVQPWEHGGPTELPNLALLCSAHHHLVHEGHWQLRPTPGLRPGHTGYWQLHPPPPPPP
ncbi:MAG: DUF222 domain-containing protein [Frankiales bacterium]|nr:DUF222 domain-containing protein [Frankiales bacterium]